MPDLRTRIIAHILKIMQQDKDYARDSLKRFDALLPELELMAGVRVALKAQA